MKLVKLIGMSLNKAYSEVCIHQNLSVFPIHNGLKEWNDLEHQVTKVQEDQKGFKLNETHELLVYFDDVNLLGESIIP
jgi:hypothetical protein